jgi:YfiH family protein
MLELPFTRSHLLEKVPNLRHGFSNLKCEANALADFAKSCATAHQIHEDTILWIDSFEKAARKADGLGTEQKNLAVGIFTADCTPLLFVAVKADQSPCAILAVHAGWRGTAMGIAKKSLLLFAEKAESLAATKILVAIGPSISKRAFEVGQEVVDAFPGAEQNGIAHFFRVEEGRRKYFFDLPGENRRQLEGTKISLPLEIDQLPDCTFSEAARYPSYRRQQGKAGRILSFLAFD